MINWIITSSVRNRFFVIIITGVGIFGGIWALYNTPVDAIPDLSDVQVIIFTEYSGQAPQVVEDQVTYPLTTAMLAVPYASVVRGYSFFGFSMVYIIFEDGTDLYWARSRVLEYLNFARGRLPTGVSPQLGPDATGVGWIYMYTLTDFSPRTAVLRQKLDKDNSGVIEQSELPDPNDQSEVGTEMLAVYSNKQLAELFSTEDPPGVAQPQKFIEDSLRFIVESFDRDRDKRISKDELEMAANFEGLDLSVLRSKQDWYLRYELMSVQGVSEVASVGGFVRQYQVEVDPEKLRAYGITLSKIKKAIKQAQLETGMNLLARKPRHR